MDDDPGALTMDELDARIRAAGVAIAEARRPMVRRLLGDALTPLRALDSRTIRAVEPAVTFDPAADRADE